MRRLQMALAMALAALIVAVPAAQVLQPPSAPPAPSPPQAEAPATAARPDDFEIFPERSALRIGQDFTLADGEAVRDAVIIFGNATIAGRVQEELVVILGNVQLASTAVVNGDFTAVGGSVMVEPGAVARRDFVVVGGTFNAPPGFTAGGEQVVIGGGLLGSWFQDFVPYVTRGLVWGRLIVPDLPWVWGVVALFFLLYLGLNLLFDRPVRACATTLDAKPLTSFGVGLLALLLVGPICLLLAVSVIGIAVVPFVLFALLAGWMIGKVAVARWTGMGVIAEDADSRAHGARSVVIGFVLISIAYMFPILGIVTWAIVGVLGLGASSLAFLSAYRRENPRPVPPAAPVTPTTDVPPPPVPAPYPPPAATAEATTPAELSGAAGEPPPAMAYQAAPATGGAAPAAAVSIGAASSSMLVSMPRALFRDRLAAFVLDIILVAITVNILDIENAFLPLLLIYHIGSWTWKHTTVGGIICQLRLVRTDGGVMTFADALVRGLASIFSLAVFFIGALWILRDPERQSWHDKIAGTLVVKVPRNWPL